MILYGGYLGKVEGMPNQMYCDGERVGGLDFGHTGGKGCQCSRVCS